MGKTKEMAAELNQNQAAENHQPEAPIKQPQIVVEAKPTPPLIYAKMAAILNEVEAVSKNKRNQQQGYQFRGIDDMYNALHPCFARHGVFITSEVLNVEREERKTNSGGLLIYTVAEVKFIFYATDGSSVTSITRGEGMDSGDKSTNKAMSGALKYALMQAFLVPTEERLDSEYDSPTPNAEPGAKPQKRQAAQKPPAPQTPAPAPTPAPQQAKPAQAAAATQDNDNRPTIGEAQLAKIIERIKNGEADVYGKAVAAFKLTQAQLDTLQSFVNL